jgi:hypothetical protein
MIILRRGPLSKRAKRSRDSFLKLAGECVTRWAFTDRALFVLFRSALYDYPRIAAAIYYRLNTLSSKVALVDVTIRQIAMPANLKSWQRHKKRMEQLLPVRNLIAHNPLLETVSSGPKRARYRYSIRQEPNEVEIGYKKPRSVDAKILRAHAKQVDKLTHRLIALVPKIVADSKASQKNPLGK